MSNSDSILSQYNEFTLLRVEFSRLYPSLKPDEIFDKPYNWILNEITMNSELNMIQENMQEIIRAESEAKNKRR